MGNLMQLAQMYSQFRQNHVGFLGRRHNITQNVNDPQEIIQHLLNSGQVSQEQVNRAMQMRNNLPQDMFR